MYTGQFVYCGYKASVDVGNVIPLEKIPDGTVISNIEEHPGDRGTLCRSTGTYATVIGHSDDG